MSAFLDAIDLLERNGWTKGALIKKDGSMCMMGALNQALVPLSEALPRRAYLEEVASLMAVVYNVLDNESPVGFNDAPTTTYEDVVLTLKRSHEKLESGASYK